MLDLYEELRKLIAELYRRHIDNALCGAIAFPIHNHPRATVDIDLMILSDSLGEAITIATELGYTIRGLDMTCAAGAIEIRRVSKIDKETGVVLSLDFVLVTAQTKQIWDSRMEANWESGKLSVVSREGLISLKELSGRPQDLADISALMEDAEDATD